MLSYGGLLCVSWSKRRITTTGEWFGQLLPLNVSENTDEINGIGEYFNIKLQNGFKGITFEVAYTHEIFSNVSGGLGH